MTVLQFQKCIYKSLTFNTNTNIKKLNKAMANILGQRGLVDFIFFFLGGGGSLGGYSKICNIARLH